MTDRSKGNKRQLPTTRVFLTEASGFNFTMGDTVMKEHYMIFENTITHHQSLLITQQLG